MLGAQTKVYVCNLIISSISERGPCAKPSRQPVMAWDLLKPSITSTSSVQSAGLHGAVHGQQQAAAGAAGDEKIAVGVRIAPTDVGQDLVAQLGDAGVDGVGIGAAVDGVLGSGLHRLGHVEVGDADAEIDGVL